MGYAYRLPKDTTQAEEVIFSIVEQGKGKRNPYSVRWWIANYYMNGYRDFSNIDYSTGTVTVSYMNEAGILKLRYEDIVARYQTQLGRLLALDLSPAVKKKGISLDGMKKSSVAQVVLGEAFPQNKVTKLELALCPLVLLYGTVGVGLWIEDSDSMGIEVIPPWELLPIPVDIAGLSDVRGLIRIRWVPTSWVRGLNITPSDKSKKSKSIDSIKMSAGVMPINVDSSAGGILSSASGGGGFFVRSPDQNIEGVGARKKKDETNVDITRLVEVWTETSDGFLGEYAIYAGVTKFTEQYRHDHTNNKYEMPVQVIRDVTVGSFWGRSFVDQLIPLNNELEIALSSFFQSLADYDLYGFQLWPTTLGNPQEAERGQDGIKRVRYEPDYTCPELKPENIMPAKMTNAFEKGIALAAELMSRIANQSEMLKGDAPGRVDSSSGLGLLYEVSNVPLSPTAKNMAEGVGGVYRAALRILKDLWGDQKVIGISNLDDTLAGLVLDTESGTINLSQNAIPYPSEVNVTIASEIPVSDAQTKMELKEARDKEQITPEEYSFEVRKRGLDLPVGYEKEWQNYRRAMLENILLFGDGKTPGVDKVIVSDRDLHRIHLNVLDVFMSRPEFYLASAEVRDKFVKHYDEHKALMGMYPDQLPMPEDIAEQTLEQPQVGPVM